MSKKIEMDAKEQEWVRRAQQGDTQAFANLVKENQVFVYNLALRILSDPVEAEDAAQEAFVRAWLALPHFRSMARFRTWMYRIVVNLCYNRLPHLRRTLAELDYEDCSELSDVRSALPSTTTDPESSVLVEERRAFLHQQIDNLPQSYRLLVMLRYQEALPYEEIASVTSLPLGTVKTGLFRARALLRNALQGYEEERR
ncbi:MAG: sigma-70 family RNA polymerase sigma factor [Anaerolineales bacterium]|nr:sigma-70 family RNA polymerase sigma factor [Anaerolineales bacterium]